MEMTRELYDRIQETAIPSVYTINGKDFSSEKLYRIEDVRYKPTSRRVNSLDSIVAILKTELNRISDLPVFVQVESERRVSVFTTYDDRYERSELYEAGCTHESAIGTWMSREEAMIALRSRFEYTADQEYLINDVLSKITAENNVTENDDGMTQSVEVRAGISLAKNVQIKPKVTLKPYRTFLEVQQPESEFLVRMNKNAEIRFFEADGGAWKIKAKQNIYDYLFDGLKELSKQGKVVVLR